MNINIKINMNMDIDIDMDMGTDTDVGRVPNMNMVIGIKCHTVKPTRKLLFVPI
jgi:hypothetical protein